MTVARKQNGKRDIYVNGPLIARAITHKELSTREVARRCGVSFNIVYRITKSNAYSTDLPLRHLLDMAELLDLTLLELQTQKDHPASQPNHNHMPDDNDALPLTDAQRLAHLMFAVPKGAEPCEIAIAFGWNLERIHDARVRANAILSPLGIYLRDANDMLYLTTLAEVRPRSAVMDDRSRLAVAKSGEQRFNIALARILDRSLAGQSLKALTHGERPKLGEALNLGYLAPGMDRDYEPTAALREAFPG